MTTLKSQKQLNNSRLVLSAVLSVFLFSACAKNPNLNPNPTPSNGNNNNASATPAPTPPANFQYQALAWESSSHPERKGWSTYAIQIADEELDNLDQVQDAGTFCPKYDSLSRQQKTNFWAQLVAGMSYYESGWNPLSRYKETTMGTDPITGQPVYSEGLLQLSYQDIRGYSFCEFEWSKDKYLSATDPKKTILDPYKNLHCGIKILASQLARKKNIVLSSGLYWAVLRKGNSTVPKIATITKKLTFCN